MLLETRELFGKPHALKMVKTMQRLSLLCMAVLASLASGVCHAQMGTVAPPDSGHRSGREGLSKLVTAPDNKRYPPSYWHVQCALHDKAGNLWFGTNGDGVYRYDGKSFRNFTREDGLCNNDVLCMLEDWDGNMWFGTRGGLCKYEPQGGNGGKRDFENFILTGTGADAMDGSSGEIGTGFVENFVWSMLQDRLGRIWFGTTEGVYFYDHIVESDENPPRFKRFLADDKVANPSGLGLKVVLDMLEDRNGNIWFASGDLPGEGLCRYDGKSIVAYRPDGAGTFRAILERGNEDILAVSQGKGLFRFNGKSFKNISNKLGPEGRFIKSAIEDRAGRLWLAIDDEVGVYCYESKAMRLLPRLEGLCNPDVYCMLEDWDGGMWFGTANTGLCRYDGKGFVDFSAGGR